MKVLRLQFPEEVSSQFWKWKLKKAKIMDLVLMNLFPMSEQSCFCFPLNVPFREINLLQEKTAVFCFIHAVSSMPGNNKQDENLSQYSKWSLWIFLKKKKQQFNLKQKEKVDRKPPKIFLNYEARYLLKANVSSQIFKMFPMDTSTTTSSIIHQNYMYAFLNHHWVACCAHLLL